LFDLVAVLVAFAFCFVAPDVFNPFIGFKSEGTGRGGDSFCQYCLSRAGQSADQMKDGWVTGLGI
jgi:hypothetical protein